MPGPYFINDPDIDLATLDADPALGANSDSRIATQKAVKSFVEAHNLGFLAENRANKDPDGGLTANSDTYYPSQKAVKTYVDAHAAAPSDTAYDATAWDGVTGVAPSKNAARDKFVSVDAAIAAVAPQTVTAASHGFAVKNVLRMDGTAYVKAQADSASNAEVIGVVTSVPDANTFVLVSGGFVSGLSGLTAGAMHFLSPTTAGALTATEPSTDGQISKPVIIAVSTTAGYFFNMRGAEVGAGGSSGGVIGQAFFDGTGHSVENLVLPAGSVIASVAYVSDGTYLVTFTVSQPDLNYQIVPNRTLSGTVAPPVFFTPSDRTVAGFTLNVTDTQLAPTQTGGIELSILRQSL